MVSVRVGTLKMLTNKKKEREPCPQSFPNRSLEDKQTTTRFFLLYIHQVFEYSCLIL